MKKSSSISAFLSSDIGILVLIALVRVALQIPTNGTYGFHQDELLTLDAARNHLAWGYVAWPPVTPALGRVALALFGLSPIGLRVFAVLVEGGVMLLTGLMVRDLGGRRWAQILAAVAVGTTPISIVQGGLFQYETFDYFFWVLLTFMVLRLLKTEDARWWLGIGATIGLGMMTKWTIAFITIGLIVGVLVTQNRRYLRSRWLWFGALLALVIWLPNVIWEFQHRWVTLDFLGSIHARDVGNGQGANFLLDQILFNVNPVMMLIVIAGLVVFLFGKNWRRYRALGWMFVVPFGVLLAAQANGFYMASAYPMLAAGGAVWWERYVACLAEKGRVRAWLGRAARPATWFVLSAVTLFLLSGMLPVAPLGSAQWNVVSTNNTQLKAEVGWPELAQQVAAVYNALPASEKASAGVMAASAGEIGSIAVYGPAYGLPPVISGFDTYWFYGYPDPPPQTVVVAGFPPDFFSSNFEDCELIGPIRVPFDVQNEETVEHNSIRVCHNLRKPWPEFWAQFQWFG